MELHQLGVGLGPKLQLPEPLVDVEDVVVELV